jgi:hypothetical protein
MLQETLFFFTSKTWGFSCKGSLQRVPLKCLVKPPIWRSQRGDLMTSLGMCKRQGIGEKCRPVDPRMHPTF